MGSSKFRKLDHSEILGDFGMAVTKGTVDDRRKLGIVHSLFNKFGTAIELAEYLESKGVDIE